MPFAQTLSRGWKRLRRSPWFPYVALLLLFTAGIGWQAWQYWWGVQIQRWLASGAGAATRTPFVPATWKSKIKPGYLEPFEPITYIGLNNPPFNLVGAGPGGRTILTRGSKHLSSKDIQGLKWLPFLKHLSISGEITPEIWGALSEVTQLRKLTVGGFPTSGISHISKLYRLQELTIRIHEGTSPADIRAIAEMPNLRKLCLGISFGRPSGQYVSPESTLPQQMKELAKSQTLTRLEMRIPNDEALLALTERLPDGNAPLSHLNELRLDSQMFSNHGGLTNSGLANLQNLPNLVHLDVSHSKVDNHGLASLKSIPTLRTLYLAGCLGIDDEGADRLAELTGLHSLNVAYTSLTEVGLMKLATLKRLRYLRLSTHFQVSAELRQKLPPTCKIDVR